MQSPKYAPRKLGNPLTGLCSAGQGTGDPGRNDGPGVHACGRHGGASQAAQGHPGIRKHASPCLAGTRTPSYPSMITCLNWIGEWGKAEVAGTHTPVRPLVCGATGPIVQVGLLHGGPAVHGHGSWLSRGRLGWGRHASPASHSWAGQVPRWSATGRLSEETCRLGSHHTSVYFAKLQLLELPSAAALCIFACPPATNVVLPGSPAQAECLSLPAILVQAERQAWGSRPKPAHGWDKPLSQAPPEGFGVQRFSSTPALTPAGLQVVEAADVKQRLAKNCAKYAANLETREKLHLLLRIARFDDSSSAMRDRSWSWV